jgi:hypothetical protein
MNIVCWLRDHAWRYRSTDYRPFKRDYNRVLYCTRCRSEEPGVPITLPIIWRRLTRRFS